MASPGEPSTQHLGEARTRSPRFANPGRCRGNRLLTTPDWTKVTSSLLFGAEPVTCWPVTVNRVWTVGLRVSTDTVSEILGRRIPLPVSASQTPRGQPAPAPLADGCRRDQPAS